MTIYIPLSDELTKEVLKLQAIEEWRVWNWELIDDKGLARLRSHVSDMVMGAVFWELHHQQQQPKLVLTHNWKMLEPSRIIS